MLSGTPTLLIWDGDLNPEGETVQLVANTAFKATNFINEVGLEET